MVVGGPLVDGGVEEGDGEAHLLEQHRTVVELKKIKHLLFIIQIKERKLFEQYRTVFELKNYRQFCKKKLK